jgi:hypothetical protein
MAANIPPPADDKDDIYAVMQKLFDDSRAVKSAHFIASQRKNRHAKIIGAIVIVLNVLIGSGLIEAVIKDDSGITTTIKALSFLAAALAGIQTFFNFQKEVECHTNAGHVYSSINHRLGLLMAEYQEQPANRPALINDFKTLNTEYLKANDEGRGCVPTDNDYKKARAGIEARKSVR